MPQIPMYESQEDHRAGVSSVYATAQQFGAGIGEAIQGFGRSLSGIAAQLRTRKQKDANQARDQMLATEVANASIRFSKINADTQLEAPKDGTGTMDTVLTRQREALEEQASLITDPDVRMSFRSQMQGRLSNYATNNVEFEVTRGVKSREEQSNFALNALENGIRGDGTMYDQHMKDGLNIINAQQLPDAVKSSMRLEWTQKAAYARFQGALASARSPEEYDALAKQLQEEKWQSAFKPNEYQSVINDIAQAKKAFVTQADTTARAALDGAEARTQKNVMIDPSEISQISSMAEQSSNPITLKRAMRLQRDQHILEKSRKLPAAELESEANKLSQEGYPGLPPRLSSAVDTATKAFPGVSASFLGNLTIQEYGVYMKRKGLKVNKAYAPKALNDRVDLKGMKPSTFDAVTLAGEIYGAPLPVMSAFRSQNRQNALRYAKGKNPFRNSIAKESKHTSGEGADISTVGMSGEQKGKLVGALIQAGFTGFGEYDTHIHADVRPSTTRGFNPETGNLGWTQGSPAVVEAMLAHGYKAGQPSTSLRRQTGNQFEEVDYTKGAIGGKTSATGPNQWTTESWLYVGRDPGMAGRIGVPEGLSDEQLLKLRDNPDWQLLFTAAYADKNGATLKKSLGREVNDAELYMAHFLGAGGAQTLISTYKSEPEVIAAQLMPVAARNNPGRFYHRDGKPLTVREVYDNIAMQFSTAPTQVQFEDAETYRRMAESNRKQETSDPMTLYNTNVAPVNDLKAEGGFAARGATAVAAADWYSIPKEEMKPFVTSEATELAKTFADGNTETKLQLIANINEMDQAAPGIGKAAFAQLNQKDSVYSHAGALMGERDDYVTADMIVRGNERLKADKAFSDGLFKGSDVQTVFNETTGGALNSIPPEARNAIFEASKAYYAESASQKGQFEFDQEAFEQAVTRVAGGADNGMGDINGALTVLPDGVDEATFNGAVDNLTDADLIAFSEDREPPIDIAGDPVAGADVAQEGTFVFIGGNQYKVRMLDGGFLTTGQRSTGGRLKAYIFVADEKQLRDTANRLPPQETEPEVITPDLPRAPTTGGMGGSPVILSPQGGG